MLQPWQNAKVVDIVNATPSTKRFFLEIENTSNFEFEPGQFITLDLPIHEQKNKRWRSYSIASHPNGTNIIELIIVLLDRGAGTNYLFNEINIGSTLVFRGALGHFVLPQQIDTDIFFICTGTGVAPFRSMIKHIHDSNLHHQNLHLIFGCRTLEDCLYKDEFLNLQQTVTNFTYTACVSREKHDYDYVQNGYVHNAYEKIILSNRVNDNNKPAHFYLCGWKNMIDEAKQKILGLGYDKKDIHLELYG